MNGQIPDAFRLWNKDFPSNDDLFKGLWEEFLEFIKGKKLSKFDPEIKFPGFSHEGESKRISFFTTTKEKFVIGVVYKHQMWLVSSIEWTHFEKNGTQTYKCCY